MKCLVEFSLSDSANFQKNLDIRVTASNVSMFRCKSTMKILCLFKKQFSGFFKGKLQKPYLSHSFTIIVISLSNSSKMADNFMKPLKDGSQFQKAATRWRSI